MRNIIILGGGIAGTTAAEELRKRQPEVHITIIEQEQHPCYSRVLLPHYVKGKVTRDKVFLRTAEWYVQQRIELMSGVRVVEIDLENRFVRTSEERELPFDQLLLTVGGEVTLLADDLRGVAYLHSVDDADHVLELLSELKTQPTEKRQAVVYGGGFIALEFINIFRHHGIAFSVVMRGPGFWSKILSAHSQSVLARRAMVEGVKIVTGEPMPTLMGEDELRTVRLSTGEELPARMLGVGIGLHLDRSILEEAKVPLNAGILADETLKTIRSDVYTAGDAAEFMDVTVGRHVIYGNWMNAQMQGRAVAATMSGEPKAFTLTSSYATNLLGMHVVFIGDVDRTAASEVRQVVAEAEVSQEWFIREGKLVGAVLIGDVKARAELTKRIGQSV